MSTTVSNSNRVVATVNALVNDVILEDQENVVVIDTSNIRIGVKKANPQYEIDVSGTINSTYTQNSSGSFTSSDLRFKHDIIDISNGLEIINQLYGIINSLNKKEFIVLCKNFDMKPAVI